MWTPAGSIVLEAWVSCGARATWDIRLHTDDDEAERQQENGECPVQGLLRRNIAQANLFRAAKNVGGILKFSRMSKNNGTVTLLENPLPSSPSTQ